MDYTTHHGRSAVLSLPASKVKARLPGMFSFFCNLLFVVVVCWLLIRAYQFWSQRFSFLFSLSQRQNWTAGQKVWIAKLCHGIELLHYLCQRDQGGSFLYQSVGNISCAHSSSTTWNALYSCVHVCCYMNEHSLLGTFPMASGTLITIELLGKTLQICKWWFFGIMGMLHEIMGVQWLTSAASWMTYQLLLGAHESNRTLCQLLHIKQLIPISVHMSNFCWWMRPTKKCCTWTDFLFWPHWLTSTQPHSNLPPWKGIHKWPCTHCFSNARHPLLPQLHSHSRIEANTCFVTCVCVCVELIAFGCQNLKTKTPHQSM